MLIDRVSEKSAILELLFKFDIVFPHLKEKIENYGEYAEKLQKNALVFTATENNSVCGMMVFYANDIVSKTSYLSLIGLLPHAQGRNIGAHLMRFWEDYSANVGMQKLKLEVDADNIHAINFYKKHNFSCANKKSDTSFYMEKNIGGLNIE